MNGIETVLENNCSVQISETFTVSQVIEMGLYNLGIRQVYGVSGANIEELFMDIQDSHRIKSYLAKSEYNASMMALGEFLVNKKPGVVLATSGGGFLNTVAILAEAKSSRIPLLVITGSILLEGEGNGGFQDGSAKSGGPDIFNMTKAVTEESFLLEDPNDILLQLSILYKTAMKRRGPCVLFVPKNHFSKKINFEQVALAENKNLYLNYLNSESSCLELTINQKNKLDQWSTHFFMRESIVIILGDELLHLTNYDVIEVFATELNAKIAVSPYVKGIWDHSDDRYVGMIGIMGDVSVEDAIKESSSVIFLGLRFDMMERFCLSEVLKEKVVLSLNTFPSFVESNLKGAQLSSLQVDDIELALKYLLELLYLKKIRNEMR